MGARPGGFEFSELRQLIRLVQRTGIGELEVTSGGRTVRIAAHAGAAPTIVTTAAAPTPTTAPAASSHSGGPVGTEHLVAIVSPMVGTKRPAPSSESGRQPL